jgi:hypothetical protein
MFGPYLSAAAVTGLALLACIVAFRGRRPVPIRRWRLALPPLLVAAAALLMLHLPPYDDLRDPEVWMIGIPFAVVGIGRGALIELQVDQGQGMVLPKRAPEEFWIAVAALLLILFDVIDPPFGTLDSAYIQAVELVLAVLASFMVGRNAALLVRSRDAPHHDL